MGTPAIAALTAAALVAFAANSLLTRLALGSGLIDAASFTAIRLASGALMLALLARGRLRGGGGGALSGLALFAYAAPFSFAYVRIGAATGALLLFGAVQLSMIGWALARGERPTPLAWLGLLLAAGGLAALNLPRATRPDPLGAALMAVAGASWAVYTLRGRGEADPVAANAKNFLWACLPALALLPLFLSSATLSPKGAGLAVVSGALSSGLGYAIWFRALTGLRNVQAAALQLAVPVIAALGAVALLGESVSPGSAFAGLAVLGGVALVIFSRAPRAA